MKIYLVFKVFINTTLIYEEYDTKKIYLVIISINIMTSKVINYDAGIKYMFEVRRKRYIMKCEKCNNEMDDNLKYCTQCGNNLGSNNKNKPIKKNNMYNRYSIICYFNNCIRFNIKKKSKE